MLAFLKQVLRCQVYIMLAVSFLKTSFIASGWFSEKPCDPVMKLWFLPKMGELQSCKASKASHTEQSCQHKSQGYLTSRISRYYTRDICTVGHIDSKVF